MSDLQLALLALGALIIVVVILFNWWQEKRLHAEASQRFAEPVQDPLMEDFRIDAGTILKNEEIPQSSRVIAAEPDEPNFLYSETKVEEDSFVSEPVTTISAPELHEIVENKSLEPSQDTEVEKAAAQFEEPVAASAAVDSQTEYHAEQSQLPADIHQQIDLVAMLFLPTPVSGADLRELLLSLSIDKPVYLYGLGIDGIWHLLTREQEPAQFSRAVCSLQLADRSGPVSREALNRFQHAVDSIGSKLGAHVEWQGGADPLVYANELDQFCIEVDKMVGFHLVQSAGGPFTGTKLRGLAEASGLVLREDGAFHYESDGGQRLFSLVNQDGTAFSADALRTGVYNSISFQLDIPRVKNSPEVFNHMVLVARQMESSLGASLVDDNQRVLSDTMIEKIRQQLKVIHARMVTRGIVPGSNAALRLFS